jgi:uncharacterized damage-inducible protein DinB
MTKFAALVIGLTFFSLGVGAQEPSRRIGLADGLKARYAESRLNLIGQADKMPEEAYAFRPTPNVRSFAQVLAHAVDTQMLACANLKGVPNPAADKNLEQELRSKAEVVRALAESFALCDEVFAATTDENAVQFVRQGPVEMPRAAVLSFLLGHNAEMYGVGTVYLRLNDLVPPSTERENARRRGPAR